MEAPPAFASPACGPGCHPPTLSKRARPRRNPYACLRWPSNDAAVVSAMRSPAAPCPNQHNPLPPSAPALALTGLSPHEHLSGPRKEREPALPQPCRPVSPPSITQRLPRAADRPRQPRSPGSQHADPPQPGARGHAERWCARALLPVLVSFASHAGPPNPGPFLENPHANMDPGQGKGLKTTPAGTRNGPFSLSTPPSSGQQDRRRGETKTKQQQEEEEEDIEQNSREFDDEDLL